MSEWFSAAELAGVIGLPSTDRQIRNRAVDEGWKSRKHTGRGGGLDYHISSLPQATQMALLTQKIDALPAEIKSQKPTRLAKIVDMAQATARQARVMLARVQVCRLLDAAMASGMSLHHACQMFAVELRSGMADQRLMMLAAEANDRPRAGHVISASTLYGWHREKAMYGDRALTPGARQKDMTVPAWTGAFLRRYQQPMKPSVEDAYRLFVKDLQGQATPSIHQVRRFLAKLSVEARELGRMGASELKAVQAYKGRAFKHLLPNDIWTADGHTFDAEISHPHYANKVFRPEITTFSDIRTRRIVGWSVDLAESTHAVLDGMRVAVKAEGVPAMLYVDNGTGYKNQINEGVMARIGTTMTHAIAYNSQAKGVIERINQMWARLAKRLPSYIGADMDKEAKTLLHKVSRKALKAGVAHRAIIGWEAFYEMAQAAIDEYNNSVHSTLKESPNACFARFIEQGFCAVGTDWDALDKLMMPMEERKTARGLIQIHGRKYFAKELVDHHDDLVMVAYDYRDAAKVWIYSQEMRLICEAVRDGHMSDYYPESRMADLREKRERAQINRLATKIETKTGKTVVGIQLEHQPTYTLDTVFNPMTIEAEKTAAQIAFEAEFYAQNDEVEWADDMAGRWRQFHQWKDRPNLTPEQRAWVDRYPKSDAYAKAKEFFESFEHPVAAGHSR
ncbi:MAG: transposase [Halothiobacillus sp.]